MVVVPMSTPREIVRPLRRVRQTREFSHEPVDPAAVDAIADAARWSGSSQNSQPWRFIVLRDPERLEALAEVGLPHTRALTSATAAIAIVMPRNPERAVSLAYDEGRAAERMLVAASMLGLGGGISWVRPGIHDAVAELLGLPADRSVRTIIALGHPSDAARQPKSAPGEARLRRTETVFNERWPG